MSDGHWNHESHRIENAGATKVAKVILVVVAVLFLINILLALVGKPLVYMSKKYKRQSIGEEKARTLASSGWWEGLTPREAATFQLFTDELSMPFEVFHEALEKTLGRPVWTHELALNFDGIAMELLGEKDAPTMKEIIGLIPEKKRIIVNLDF